LLQNAYNIFYHTLINRYFASVGVPDNNVTPQCNEVVLENVHNTVHICETDVLRSINKLKCNTSCGPDEVPPVLIKRPKHCVCKPVKHGMTPTLYLFSKTVLMVMFLTIARYHSLVF